ncbi:CHRD domain-containing protein [Massilia sp. Mn16-1_5]|uniref:CHRD domain-containing protein n=1 Tax=Massilia sp. Mn16-1_5 TaxID=2079199 RepID=UPI00109E7FF8|nr:CHRD domain-containing protein [Massilia sp. Mn16-1_5]THC44672.1 PEP-CTERM sorting domain-containing protein [Massilia sp. Mn16-1_5]
MKQSLSILALAAATLCASGALAQTTIRAVASGPGESPPNGSPGSSVAAFEIDGSVLRAEVPFRDLLAGTTMAHIHCCTTAAFTGTAQIAIPFVDFPLGVTAGTYTHAFDLTDAAVYDPAFLAAFGGTPASASTALIDAINANEAYLNIHTSQFPAGEIRGFMVAAPIPEPATWGMLGMGLAGLGMLKRRRRA